MRVAVKNMSGVFIHSTTPRKARLLLKEKKAVIESNNPFTIRLLFSVSECGLKDSKPLNKLNSGLLPEKDLTMCENEETKVLNNNTELTERNFNRQYGAYGCGKILRNINVAARTHLIYGAYGCGKTSMVMDIINERIENDNNTMLLTTSCIKRLFYKNTKSPMIRIVDESCINVTADNNTPELFAKYLVQYYISREGRLYADTIIVDDYPFSTINADYSEEEYFRELTKACKENKINLIYTKGTSSKDGVYSSLPPIFERFSDIITVLK